MIDERRFDDDKCPACARIGDYCDRCRRVDEEAAFLAYGDSNDSNPYGAKID